MGYSEGAIVAARFVNAIRDVADNFSLPLVLVSAV